MADTESSVLDVADMSTSLRINGTQRPVVRHMTVSIGRGEVVGLVGESGSGKSITARSIIGLLPAGAQTTGRVRVCGVDLASLNTRELRELRSTRVGMIFQDPRAHIDPLWRIEDYVGEGLRRHKGLDRSAARERSKALLKDLGIVDADRVLHSYPGQMSGGMLQRAMIAGALSCEPELIIADEATTALDVTVQSDIMAILADLRGSRGLSLIFITHDLELAAVICDRIVVMYAGSPMLVQSTDGLFNAPAHPYAAALVAARPQIEEPAQRLQAVAGRPISALEAPSGCPFRSRCPYAAPECADAPSTLTAQPDGALTQCLRADELRSDLARSVTTRG